ILAGVGVQRDDGRCIEVVTAPRAARLGVVGSCIGGPDVNAIELGVEGDAVPGATSSATLLPELTIPGLCSRLQSGVTLVRLWTRGHDIEAPDLLPGLLVISRDIATHAEIGAALADDDLAVEQAGSAGHRLSVLRIGRLDAPDHPAGFCIQCEQSA